METPPVALTIAGSDSGGAAGVQADLKTFSMFQVYGLSVLTALTAQNSVEVRAVSPVPTEFVAAQLDAVLDDLPVAAVKTGMLATEHTVALVADLAVRLPHLVVDPVLVSAAGAPLFAPAVTAAYVERLIPRATVVAPNLHEAGVLLGREVTTVDDAAAAAHALGALGPVCVVVKGGRLRRTGEAVDTVWHAGEVTLLEAGWVDTANTHGSGDVFAAAVVARLAHGDRIHQALVAAKEYVHEALALSAGWRLGGGHGPLGWRPR
jgi:hydroxymethylpyrimidine/phosphomethylpyrimidine kinase